MGSLLVLASHSWLKEPLFSRSGDQRDDWHEATVDTSVSNHERVGRMFELNRSLYILSGCLSKQPLSTYSNFTKVEHFMK